MIRSTGRGRLPGSPGWPEFWARSVHLGTPAAGTLLRGLASLGRDWGPGAGHFLRHVLSRRWRSLETAGEALWAAAAGVHLGQRVPDRRNRPHPRPLGRRPRHRGLGGFALKRHSLQLWRPGWDLHPPDGALLEKLAAASLVRTNTRANERHLAAVAPREAAKIVNIYNGVSLVPEPAPPRRRQPPFRLLALGRLVPKGYAVLLAACRLLAREGFDFHLTLAGDGPERWQLQRLIERYGLEGRVALPGFVPHREVPHLLQAADLFIMPSLIAPSGDRDGIPNVVLEALLHEVPVVATEISGLPEVIHPGTTGWLTRRRTRRAWPGPFKRPRLIRGRPGAGPWPGGIWWPGSSTPGGTTPG